MKKLILITTALLILAGCKATVETEVSVKDLLESESKMINGELYVEVASCNSYEDSTKPSNSVIKVQESIPTIFKDAKYIKCARQNFDSLVHFSLPIALDTEKDDKLASDSHINILSNEYALLMLVIPESIKTSIDKVKKDSFGANAFDLDINITLKNDSGKKVPFNVLASYINDTPYEFSGGSIKNGGQFVITPSDVTVDRALQASHAVILDHPAKIK